MSFLAPLYALGFLAIAAPIYFHLVRRRPKGEVPFSSLMFLSPSPPPPTTKRRFEQIFLLILRSAALLLLGIAFMRPFLREEATAEPTGTGTRVVVLVDTSASMRLGDLWDRTIAEANAAIEKSPQDHAAIFAFDRTIRPVLGFEETKTLEPLQRIALAKDRLAKLHPGYANTELGTAILDGVRRLRESSDASKGGRIVLVTDLQQGAKLAGLEGFEWPADVELELHTITDGGGNVGLDVLVDRAESERSTDAAPLRVRVVNDAASKSERYSVAWDGATDAIDVYVPPGDSRVVKVPRPVSKGAEAVLRLRGDPHAFDNTLHFATPKQEELQVHYLGSDDPKDASKLLYFLERAWSESPDRVVKVTSTKPEETLAWQTLRASPLVVLGAEVSESNASTLSRYLAEGGTVLSVVTTPGLMTTLAKLTGAEVPAAVEAKLERYAMLQGIAFDHPLFAPLAGPQFGDFTKVHVWKHRHVSVPGSRVLARFDDGDPAVLEKTLGRGRVLVFTFGWHPADSELSRSTRFVPLMTSLLDLRYGRRPETVNHRVGDRLPLPASTGALTVRKPDGTSVNLAPGASTFDDTDAPGVYVIETATGPRPVAVNLDPAESLTSPIPVESLEKLGVRLAKPTAEAERTARAQQLRDVELEHTQSLWRILILVAILVLLAETALAGRRSRLQTREA